MDGNSLRPEAGECGKRCHTNAVINHETIHTILRTLSRIYYSIKCIISISLSLPPSLPLLAGWLIVYVVGVVEVCTDSGDPQEFATL